MPTNKHPDWWQKLGAHTASLMLVFILTLRPPSRVPIWQWLEECYDLILGKSALPGRVSFEFLPASKFFFNHAQDYRCSRITEMVCHQSGKTENAIMLLNWSVVEVPLPTMWVMANADQCEDFGKDRMFPAFENCPPAFAMAPKEREKWTRRMVQFDSMTLHLRGSNARGKLKSSPIGRIICDERADWKPGSIGTLRERLTTFSNSQEISMGTPGKENDELHTDWKEGSQTFMHFHCLDCNHSQPFRFGKDATVLFPKARDRGGLVWPCNDETKPNGVWDLTDGGAVERLTRFECEQCGRLYQNGEKVKLIKTIHEHHRNPDALPSHYSSSRNVLMMPWAKVAWGKIAVKFLKAVAAMKTGDMEPMITLVQEDFGEPWRPLSSHKTHGDLLDRQGEYKLGEYWADPTDPKQLEKGSGYILTFDRQNIGRLVYVVRQWRPNGQSRLIRYGEAPSLDDMRTLQIEMKIKNRCVGGDDHGPNVSSFRQKCMMWNWLPLFGEDQEQFTIQHSENGVNKSYRQGWRDTELDPGIGTTAQGPSRIPGLMWSNPWFKDKLYHFFICGQGPLWEIPTDAPAQYLKELNANEWREKEINGRREHYWHETGEDHAADCELEQIAMADKLGLTRAISKTNEGK